MGRGIPEQATTVVRSSAGRDWKNVIIREVRHNPTVLRLRGSSGDRIVLNLDTPHWLEGGTGDRRFRVRSSPGSVTVIPRLLDSHWELREPVHVLQVIVTPTLSAAIQGRDTAARRNEPDPAIALRVGTLDPLIESACRELLSLLDTKSPHTERGYVDALVALLRGRLARAYADENPEADGHAALGEIAVRYIADHLDADLSLRGIAHAIGSSETRLKTDFAATIGRPVHRYVLDRRLARAQTLLLTTTMPIAAVAAEAGFYDQSHLTRQLRARYGLTPLQVRNLSARADDSSNAPHPVQYPGGDAD